MTQIFGKAQYQKGRTTVKDPYLHFQNEAKPRTSRIPSPKRADSEFMASLTQPTFLRNRKAVFSTFFFFLLDLVLPFGLRGFVFGLYETCGRN